MTVVDASKKAATSSEQRLTEHSIGSFLVMNVQAPAKVKAFEDIREVNVNEHRLSWGTKDFPAWALRTERRQTLKRSLPSSGESSEKTHYECLALFDGPLAHVLKLAMSAKLQASFEATAAALKERAEKRSGV